jgi:hypothetical protein
MDVAEFEELIDRLGEDVRRWPSPAREAALALLQNSAAARDVLGRAEELRRLLAAPPDVKAPAGLADRIVANARRSEGRPMGRPVGRRSAPIAVLPPVRRPWIPPLQPAVVLSLCFAFGLTIGLLPDESKSASTFVDFPTLLAHLID